MKQSSPNYMSALHTSNISVTLCFRLLSKPTNGSLGVDKQWFIP